MAAERNTPSSFETPRRARLLRMTATEIFDEEETTPMTDRTMPVTEDELHAYVDNELPAERRGDVEAWLAGHPDDAARVQSWRAMAEALHARYDSVADEAVPKRLEIERLVRQPRKWFYGAVAATLVA